MGRSFDPREELGPVEELVAECLEAWEDGDAQAVEAVCARRPELTAQIRRKLALLQRVGFQPEAPPALEGLDARYTILRELGRGGMGVVYLAHDRERDCRVALKTGPQRLAATKHALERFQREMRAVAQLTHPSLVSIEAVGESAETAWFTMEYVEGATLAQVLAAVREERVAPEDLEVHHLWEQVGAHVDTPSATWTGSGWGKTWVETICRLLVDVADGLAHVHANGIVHRDVKPSNILVGLDGRARVFDFGLAHLQDEPGITQTGEFAGTPHYVAPEQIADRGAIDARTDVFALGVTLYELLTLQRPFIGKTTPQVLHAIQAREPALPRRLSPHLPRDLETICMTALEKEPERRYSGAAEMAADLRRFLEFRPVQARPIGVVRRGVRFFRRRPATAAAVFLGALVALGTPLGLAWANAAIRDQRDRAEAAAIEARAEARHNKSVLDFFTLLFVLDSESDEPVSARELVDEGAARASGYDDDPLLQASVMETMGRAYRYLGQLDRAIPLLDRALALREREVGEAHVLVATVIQELARAHLQRGHLEWARDLGRRSLAAFEAAGEPTHPDAARCHVTLAELALAREDRTVAREEFLEALRIQRLHRGELAREAAVTLTHLGELARESGNYVEAEARLEEALAIRRDHAVEADLPEIAASLELLGDLHLERADPAAARERFAEALGLYRKEHGDLAPPVANLLERLCATLVELGGADAPGGPSLDEALLLLARNRRHGGDLAGAEATYRELSARLEDREADVPELAASALLELAELLASTRPKDAEPWYRHAAAVCAAYRPRSPESIQARSGLAACLASQAELDEADRLYTTLATELSAAEPRDGVTLAAILTAHADVIALLGRPEDAERLRAEVELISGGGGDPTVTLGELELRYGFRDTRPPQYATSFQAGITALQAAHYHEAARHFERCLDVDPKAGTAAYNLSCAFARLGRIDASFGALRRAAGMGLDHCRDRLDVLAKDPDLALVRADARFPALSARLQAARAAAERYVAEPAVHVPDQLRGATSMPLVILLHAEGRTKDDVVRGPWRDLADELGFALLAPSGRVSLRELPQEGMTWISAIENYERRYRDYEEPINRALDTFRADHPIDGERIFLVGEGVGGAVAFNVAIHSPDLYRGVLVLQGTLFAELSRDRARNLATMGTKVLVRVDPRHPVAGVPEELPADRFLRGLTDLLRAWGVAPDVRALPTKGDRTGALRAALGALMAD